VSETQTPAGPGKRLSDVLNDGVQDFYRAQGCSLVHVDLMFLDRERPDEQILAVLRGLSGFAHEDGTTRFGRITIVVPADELDAADRTAFDERLQRFVALVRERLPVRAIPDDWLVVKFCPHYQEEALLDIARAAPEETAVIVSQLASYRCTGLLSNDPGPHRMRLEEDVWAPHVLAITKSLEAIAEARKVYIAALVGRAPPHRPALVEAMRGIKGGVLTSERADDLDAALLAHDEEIAAHLDAGRIGAALAVIDGFPEALERQKPFVKVQLLQRANLPQLALDQIERQFAQHLGDYDPASLFKLAVIAEQAGGLVLAAKLLRASIPNLSQPEFLDGALELAGRLDEFGLEDQVVARVKNLFPDSVALKRHDARKAADAGDFARAGTLLVSIPGSEEPAAFHKALGDLVPTNAVIDHDAVLAALVRQKPDWRRGGHRVLVREALRRGQLYHAFRWSLDADATLFSPGLLLDVLERLVLARSGADDPLISPEDSELAVRRLIRYLADTPAASGLRVRLIRWLEPSSVGFTGLALVLHVALGFVFRDKHILKRLPEKSLSREEGEKFEAFLRVAMRWMGEQKELALGRSTMPAGLLSLPAERICRGLGAMIVDHKFDFSDLGDVKLLHVLAQIGALVGAHASRLAPDIEVVRLAASRLAPAGYTQMARDLAETAMEMAGDDPVRKRQAWLAMADIAQRGANKYEALVALAAGATSDAERDVEQAWEEYQIAVRLCRDLGFLREASRGVDRLEKLADEVGIRDANGHRLDLLRIQIAQRQMADGNLRVDEVLPLLELLVANANAAAEQETDSTPIALTLGQVLAQASMLGAAIPDAAQRSFDHLLAGLPKDSAELVRTMSTNTPSADQLLQTYKRAQPARYAEDVGFDAQPGAILARRFLGGADIGANSDAAILAVEMLADRSVTTPAWEAVARPAPAAGSARELAGGAKVLSCGGASLLLLGLDRDGTLIRTSVESGTIHAVEREPKAVFDREALTHWSQDYPYRYAFDTVTPNLFDVSTRGIGLSDLPEGPLVIVADTRLQGFPPVLWRSGDAFAGEMRPVAMVPSLSWWMAARDAPRIVTDRRVAWISDAGEHGTTLAMVSERLGPILEEHSIALNRGRRLPQGFDGAELAIVTAHGGLLDEARFFQNVRDEGNVVVDMRAFAAAFHNVGVVILFVCSAGRLDHHPDAVANMGLARKLLDAGCTSVIASPWPLDARVTYHWLPAFLTRWEAGDDVMTACFAANLAVRIALGGEPRDWLALSVFGDPYRRRGRAGLRRLSLPE
jgi:hypothetical protein